ncbi:hypothetical protein TNCT6_72110 [Streptomyces sp. 6-11-2]|nr:hypothetical protein TNCT6_72110 [Streptomyces sp. 6-11-2]
MSTVPHMDITGTGMPCALCQTPTKEWVYLTPTDAAVAERSTDPPPQHTVCQPVLLMYAVVTPSGFPSGAAVVR